MVIIKTFSSTSKWCNIDSRSIQMIFSLSFSGQFWTKYNKSDIAISKWVSKVPISVSIYLKFILDKKKE